MYRTSSLTRCCTCLIAIDLGIVTIVIVPLVRSPLLVIRKLALRISNLCAVLLAKLLAELSSADRTYLYALTAGNTLLLLNMCSVS